VLCQAPSLMRLDFQSQYWNLHPLPSVDWCVTPVSLYAVQISLANQAAFLIGGVESDGEWVTPSTFMCSWGRIKVS
jgi:hypothetical protein